MNPAYWWGLENGSYRSDGVKNMDQTVVVAFENGSYMSDGVCKLALTYVMGFVH